MKVMSLFSGVGGFELGIQHATKGKWECVGYSEIDKYSCQVFEKHFPGVKNYGNAKQINTDELPDFDFLCGGFPCQAFSIAGKRRGFEDTRGTLFFEIARILKVKRPKMLLLENVKGLLNHDKGKTFATIIQTLAELGYRTQWMVLNSKFFGVAQNRERVFIIGVLGNERRPEVLPFRENATEVQGIHEEEIVSPTITTENAHGYGNTVTCGQTKAIYKIHRANEIRESKDSPCLAQAMGTGGNNVPMVVAQSGRNKDNPSDRTPGNDVEQRFEPNTKGTTNTLSSVQKDNLVAPCLNPNDLRKGFSGQNRNSMLKIGLLRRLTPIECERLQGFPDNWTDICSDTQRYKQMGNAVTVNVIEEIVKRINNIYFN